MKPFITVTGANEKTGVENLAKLDAEIGLLYSATPEGRPRYPTRDWIKFAAVSLPRASIHICGRIARQELFGGGLIGLLQGAGRIQVNGLLSIPEVERVCAMYPDKTIITQGNRNNDHLVQVKALNHAILMDSSGGRGLVQNLWNRPTTEKQIGFAGGLGPNNMAFQLPKIRKVALGSWWVDMEGSLMVGNEFSFLIASAAVRVFHALMQDNETRVKSASPLLAGIKALTEPDFHALNIYDGRNDRLLHAVLCAYAKHHLGSDDIGWEKLGEILHSAICNVIGDESFIDWAEKIKGGDQR